ncbi:MAG: hypothetical protein JNL58_27785 [Planctomyces sp.]|nr:hypothetical protein [Planctomyces sp.]
MVYWLPLYLHLTLLSFVGSDDLTIHHSFRYYSSGGWSQQMQSLTFSPDSQQLAVSVAGHVDLTSLQDGEVTAQFQSSPFSMRYTPDGKRLLMISTYESRLLDVQRGAIVPSQHQPLLAVPGVNLEVRNGKLLIKSLVRGGSADASESLHVGDEIVAFSNGRNGKMERTTGSSVKSVSEAFEGYAGTFLRLTVMPRGKHGSKNEKTVTLRRTTCLAEGRNGGTPIAIGRPLPKALAWCMADGAEWHQFRDAMTGQPIIHLETIDIKNVGRYTISPDQTRFEVVAGRKDGLGNGVEVFDLASQERLAFIPLDTASFYDIAFAHDNNRVLVGTWDTVEICDTSSASVSARMTLGYELPEKGESTRRAGTIGGMAIQAAREEIGVGYTTGGQSPLQLVERIAVSPQDVVAIGDRNGNVGLWDLKSGKPVKTIPAEGQGTVEHLEFSPNGHWLAYYVDGTLHLEDVSSEISSQNRVESPETNELIDNSSGESVGLVPQE